MRLVKMKNNDHSKLVYMDVMSEHMFCVTSITDIKTMVDTIRCIRKNACQMAWHSTKIMTAE